MGLRSRTSNRADERICHSHPALTVGAATRIKLHRRTQTDGARQLILLCSALIALQSGSMPRRCSQSSTPPFFFCRSFFWHCFMLIPASGSFAASAFPVPPLHHWVPSHKAAARVGSSSLAFGCPRKMGQKKEILFWKAGDGWRELPEATENRLRVQVGQKGGAAPVSDYALPDILWWAKFRLSDKLYQS
jgi:hypothetical protein